MPEIMYRPPFEAGSFLLEVTKSCSHNRCSFCTMYRDVPFRVIAMEEVEAQIRDAVPYAAYIDRVFLENGDAFVLSADKLIEIAELIHMYLPRVETIAMYASIKNIQGKTDDELKALRQLGINELNIGVESGLDDCYYFGLHPSNVVNMHGTLKKDIGKLMHEISRKREALKGRLDERPVRTGEGAIINML